MKVLRREIQILRPLPFQATLKLSRSGIPKKDWRVIGKSEQITRDTDKNIMVLLTFKRGDPLPKELLQMFHAREPKAWRLAASKVSRLSVTFYAYIQSFTLIEGYGEPLNIKLGLAPTAWP